jgi:UDPglucose--hexose-1-phosphate uridylyltransferase
MPELRRDPITGREVYVAEERAGRPTDYGSLVAEEAVPAVAERIARRDGCPFCAGHEHLTPDESASVRDGEGQWLVRVVPNKFPAVAYEADSGATYDPSREIADDSRGASASISLPAFGAHEVVVESPRHDLDFVDLDAGRLGLVLRTYRDRLRHWSADARLRHAIVFKNSGRAAGASLEHVHSQIVALPYVPAVVETELAAAERRHAQFGRCPFCDLVAAELTDGRRVVIHEAGFLAVAAVAGRQPLETWVLPEQHAARFDEASEDQLDRLAAVLDDLIRRLHRVRRRPAYNLVLHTGPFDHRHAGCYHWHWEFIPRTTELAGLEWGAGVYLNPVSPERAAALLRAAGS